ncbi:MAG TPA: hypothetical protein VGG26_05520 [Terracidiphilus sp.]|jgi:hypothetical protein
MPDTSVRCGWSCGGPRFETKVNLFVLSLFLLTAIYSRATTLPDACGGDKIRFDVKTQKNPPALAPPAAGKAQIVFVENFAQNEGFCVDCKVTTRVGVDGAWAGANHGNSYFAYPIDPGEHHLCADWQSNLGSFKKKVGLASLNAEADKVYYYEIKVRIKRNERTTEQYLDLTPLDPDEGKYLAKIDPMAIATAKK